MKLIRILVLVLCSFHLFAQEDLMKELEQSQKPQTTYTTSTFKGTRLVNGQTVETKGKGALEFIFAHRFGAANSGIYNLFGLDNAHVRIGLEYGLTDRLGVSIGRSSEDKTIDGFCATKWCVKVPVSSTCLLRSRHTEMQRAKLLLQRRMQPIPSP